jgi:hypothetical protein
MADIEMIDGPFWLKFAREHVLRAISERDEAAGKLDTLLTWVWGAYTTFFSAAVFVRRLTDDLRVSLFIALPMLVIPVAKFFCTEVQLPISTSFYPNIPQSIQTDLYVKVIERKTRLLRGAKIWAGISVFLIGASLITLKLSSDASDRGSKGEHKTDVIIKK